MDHGSITIPLGRDGKYGRLAVDTTRFTEAVHTHIYTYGLRQILNDAIADKKDDDGEVLPTDQLVAKSEKRLATLYSGDIRAVRVAAAEPTDPIEIELIKMLKPDLQRRAKSVPEWKLAPKAEKDKALWVINTRAEKRGDATYATWRDLIVQRAKPEQLDEAERRAELAAKTEASADQDI